NSATQLGTTSNTYYDDTTALANVTYTYWVRARNSTGTGNVSSGNDGYVLPPTPGTPTGLTASDGTYTDRVYIQWNQPANATMYEVQRKLAAGSTFTYLAETSMLGYMDTTAVPGIVYSYRVRGKNGTVLGA